MDLVTARARRTAARLVAVVVALAALGASLGIAHANSPSEPLRAMFPADAPDPEIVALGEDRYALYSTNTVTDDGFLNVPVHTWDPDDGWRLVGDALPRLPNWSDAGYTWAPGVIEVAGAWALYFAAPYRSTGRQCIGVAFSTRPTGPFVSTASEPLVCQLERGGSIDPSPFRNADGQLWLLWKSDDNALDHPTALWSQALVPDGGSFVGGRHLLMTSGAGWERGVIENPEMVRRHGIVHLVYSGGRWDSSGYAIGHAVCDGVAGPCRRTSDGPVISSMSGAAGPGGASVTTFAGWSQLVMHAWTPSVGYHRGGVRAPFVLPIRFQGSDLSVATGGPTLGGGSTPADVEIRSSSLPVSDSQTTRFGFGGGTHLACDFDGVGRDSIVWVTAGYWSRSDRPADHPGRVFLMGQTGDDFYCADVDGDGDDDPGIRRGNYWFVANRGFVYGRGDDHPVVGDWDGDGRETPGIYRPSDGTFHLRDSLSSGPGQHRVSLGGDSLVGVVGDWDGDGVTEVGVRDDDGTFRLALENAVPVDVLRFRFGSPTGQALAGDHDGDGIDTVAVASA